MTVLPALAAVAGLLFTTVVAVTVGRGRPTFIYLACCAFCGGLVVLALGSLFSPPSIAKDLILPLGLPWIGLHFTIDALSAAFLLVVNLTAAIISIFAIGYSRHEHANGRVLPFYPAFLAGMNLVVLADDGFGFLLAWEFMSLTSWALVLARHREPENAHAAYVYFVMAGLGTLTLLLVFGLMAGADGTYTFAAMRNRHLSPLLAGLVMVLALVGTGSKAGLVPLHIWLPLAHPAAPSHVSALMSGIMTKVAVYGFIRIAFDLSGNACSPWFGGAVIVVGAATAFLGVLQALMQHDLKKLLAYHTVENIGIIYIGLGLALAFKANGIAAAAALALVAALFHVFNHSVFKSLLFLGAGAVLNAAKTRDVDHLGGLIHRMPVTAATFLIGCAAISALPPLNGFVSEWLVFQAILLSPALPQWVLKFLAPAAGAVLAVSAALAAACFVKAFGITFLGRPRSTASANAGECDIFGRSTMIVLAAICVVAGIVPGLFIDRLASITKLLVGSALVDQSSLPWLSLVPISADRSSYNGILLFSFIAFSAGAMAMTARWVASRRLRRAPAWDCGFPDPRPETQYTASSFAQPIRRVFGAIFLGARETVVLPPPGDLSPASFSVAIHDRIWDMLYRPTAVWVNRAADRLNRFQFLTVRRYLTLVFATLVFLLSVLAFMSRS